MIKAKLKINQQKKYKKNSNKLELTRLTHNLGYKIKITS
jgi:hypothetical protein